jgi:hypothetical protein
MSARNPSYIAIFTKCCLDYQVKGDKMGKAGSAHGICENYEKQFVGKPEGWPDNIKMNVKIEYIYGFYSLGS